MRNAMSTKTLTPIENLRFVEKILNLAIDYDEYFWWRRVNVADGDTEEIPEFRVFINCNDLFWWGTADSEEITESNLPALAQAFADCAAIPGAELSNGKHMSNHYFGSALFASRMRSMRPQGAYYKHIPFELHELFNACGPPREIDFFNPKDQEGNYKYVKEGQEDEKEDEEDDEEE